MSLVSPIALDALVEEARRTAPGDFDARFSDPVLVVVSSGDNVITERISFTAPPGSKSSAPSPAAPSGPASPTTLVFWLRPKPTSANPKRLSIGRDDSSDVAIAFGSLSSLHAWFDEASPGTWRIEDASSTNGTWVDGRPVRPMELAQLRDGCEVKLGEVVATFWLGASFRTALRRRAGLE